MEKVERCNLCDGSLFSVFTEMIGHKIKQRFSIVRCDECSLVFVSPRLTVGENRDLYDRAYFNGEGFDRAANYERVDQQRGSRDGENRGILDKIRVLKPARQIRILDVGCGTGSLLRALEAAGYSDLVGIDLSEYAAQRARRGSSAQVWTGDLIDTPLPDASVDVINATEVIEHVRDPLAFFRKIKALLRPNGIFIYSTGNARGIYARVLGRWWPYLHPEGHLFYFSPRTMLRYFDRVDLRPLAMRELDRATRETIALADDRIAHSQLGYLGQQEHGIKRLISRSLESLDTPVPMRAWSLVLGKSQLPIGVRRC